MASSSDPGLGPFLSDLVEPAKVTELDKMGEGGPVVHRRQLAANDADRYLR
jgi:hypothetical protein